MIEVASNPGYLGGRYQEDHRLKTVQAKSLQNPILKIPNTQKKTKNSTGRVVQVEE
jgi:hypothetical protein